MNIEEQRKLVENVVDEFIDSYLTDQYISMSELQTIMQNREHILNIGTSILCTKWKIGYPGGSFVEAIVNNDLSETFSRADIMNRQVVFFYCKLMYNANYPKELIK